MNRIENRLLALFVFGALLILVGCSKQAAPPEAAPSFAHTPLPESSGMLEITGHLRRIANNANPMTNEFANDSRAKILAQEVEGESKEQRQQREFNLGREYLRAGHSTAAIRVFERLSRELKSTNSTRATLKSWVGLSYLRLGEQQNCVLNHTSNSCLFPIQKNGVHQLREGSERALGIFLELLEMDIDEGLQTRSAWLANIAAMTLGVHPDALPEKWRLSAASLGAEFDIGRFPDIAANVGLAVSGLSGASVIEDFDGDNNLDVFVTSWGIDHQMQLFINKGDSGFIDATNAAGLTGLTGGLNAVPGDFDNDGDVDIFILRGAWLNSEWAQPNSLLQNNGDATFKDITQSAGLLDFHPTQTAAWADYDNDGWLDLYVGNESDIATGETHPNQLFHNNGDGTFTDVAKQTGTALYGFTKAVVWGDYNNDGRTDLFVSQLGSPNVLLRNEVSAGSGQIRFRNVAREAGVDQPVFSFPAWFWDYNNDGFLDLFVSGYGPSPQGAATEVAAEMFGRNFKATPPKLYKNKGDGTFEDVTSANHLHTVLYTMGANYGDLDNDGYLDFYAGTGDPDLRSLMPNRMFRNNAAGAFQDVTTSGGFGHLQKGHAVSFADLDNDGDQDVHAVIGGAFSGDVYQNALFENPGHKMHWIKLRLSGIRSNRSGIGARIRVTVNTADGPRTVHNVVSSGGSFGANPLIQHIGLGDATRILRLEIVWPATGEKTVVENLALDSAWRVTEGLGKFEKIILKKFDFSSSAEHTSHPH